MIEDQKQIIDIDHSIRVDVGKAAFELAAPDLDDSEQIIDVDLQVIVDVSRALAGVRDAVAIRIWRDAECDLTAV